MQILTLGNQPKRSTPDSKNTPLQTKSPLCLSTSKRQVKTCDNFNVQARTQDKVLGRFERYLRYIKTIHPSTVLRAKVRDLSCSLLTATLSKGPPSNPLGPYVLVKEIEPTLCYINSRDSMRLSSV